MVSPGSLRSALKTDQGKQVWLWDLCFLFFNWFHSGCDIICATKYALIVLVATTKWFIYSKHIGLANPTKLSQTYYSNDIQFNISEVKNI